MAPLYYASDISVASTDVFTACQTTDFAKQLSIKFSSLSGFFDLTATIGVAFLKNYQDPTMSNPLYDAFMTVQSATTCAETMNNAGQALQYSFGYSVKATNFASELPQNLVNDMF